jgi:hypothetical protein
VLLRRTAIAAVALASLVVASPASGLFKEKSVSGNLDGDPNIEQVKAERIPDAADPADDDLAQTAVDVLDTCGTTPLQTRITTVQEALVTLRLVDADTHPGKDVFTDLRSGASGRVGEIRLVSWRPQVGGPICAVPHILFKYSSRHPTHRPPGTVAMSDFVVSLRDFTPRFRGRELRLSEGWVTRTDALCCPTFEKTSFYRYVPARDRFIRYHTDLKRDKQH